MQTDRGTIAHKHINVKIGTFSVNICFKKFLVLSLCSATVLADMERGRGEGRGVEPIPTVTKDAWFSVLS
jgi:hypothetical protein